MDNSVEGMQYKNIHKTTPMRKYILLQALSNNHQNGIYKDMLLTQKESNRKAHIHPRKPTEWRLERLLLLSYSQTS